MKIVHVISGLSLGGAESALLKVVTGTKDDFCHCVIVLGSNDARLSQFSEKNISVKILGMSGWSSVFSGVFTLFDLIRKERPNLIQTWMYHADLLGGLAGWMLGVPVVWNVRQGSFDPNGTGRRTKLIARLCAVLSRIVPQKVVSCARSAVDYHVELGYAKKKFVVIPNGIDVVQWKYSSENSCDFRVKYGIPNDAFVLGHVGRAHAQKNHQMLLDVFSKISLKYHNCFLILCGQGLNSDSDYWRNFQISDFSKPNIRFIGGRDHGLESVFSASDLFLLSSSFGEAFPNVLIEAMACGIPCIVTDVGDSKFIVKNSGFVTRINDVDAFVEYIEKYLILSHLERDVYKVRAREIVLNNFSNESISDLYCGLWTELVMKIRQGVM